MSLRVQVCVCLRACARACVRECMPACVCVWEGGGGRAISETLGRKLTEFHCDYSGKRTS